MNEKPLLFKMLYTMDGNDSLRRILRRSASQDDSGTLGPSSELPSTRHVPGDRYLSREDVDKWADGVLQEMMGKDTDSVRERHNFTQALSQTLLFRLTQTIIHVLTDGRT
jgi:hypothetical protein